VPNFGPLWRFVITDILEGAPLSTLDRVARERSIQYERNKTTTVTGTVSSDSPAVNTLFPDVNGGLFPYLAEGDRLLYCLRRDGGLGPNDHPDRVGGTLGPWYPRASGIILQYDDAATSEDGQSTFTAYDPWEYLYHIPVIAAGASAPLLHDDIVRYDDDLDVIIIDLLETAEQWYSGGTATPRHGVPSSTSWDSTSGPRKMFLDWGWSAFYQGTIDIVPQPLDGNGFQVPMMFQQGTSIGAAIDQLIAIGDFDVVMTPIYDPVNRPGILCELSIINQVPQELPGAIFAWDYSPWSVSEISRLVDGTGRRNRINLHLTQGGPSVGVLSEMASVNRFGEYWDEQWIIDEEHTNAVSSIAQTLLDTISEHPRTVEISPLPERSPEPFIDWNLGDEVIVQASSNLRATMSGFQRVHAFELDISDDALEQVVGLRVYIPGSTPSQ
jgi:hypothetical protein